MVLKSYLRIVSTTATLIFGMKWGMCPISIMASSKCFASVYICCCSNKIFVLYKKLAIFLLQIGKKYHYGRMMTKNYKCC
jgi:hypothetical protein